MENKPKRTLVIGDIHGALKALVQVLQRCKFDPQEDQIIFLGDYSDGWGETAELIEYLIELEKTCTHKPIFLKGNHDEWTREWLNSGIQKDMWIMQGGKATYDSYIRTGYLVKQEHRDFYNKLHNYYVDEENRGFVHGGFVSKQGLGHEPYDSNYYWDRTLWDIALAMHNRIKAINKIEDKGNEEFDEFFRPIPYRFEKHKEIYIGHTATTNWTIGNGPITEPMLRCNVINMDTGGGFNGKVSIMDIDTKQFWQSDFTKELYPNEKGRG